MKTVAAAAALLFLSVSVASAQSTTSNPGATPNPQAPPAATSGRGAGDAAPGPNNNVVNRPGVNNAAAPVAGANSFTEGQAKSRLEGSGFSNVTDLKKDDNGVWRATAMRDGKSVSVSLDYQGNVVAK